MNSLRFLLATTLFAMSVMAHAQLNKCVGPDGKTSYQSDPCPETSKSQGVRPPPPGPSSSAGSAAAPAGWERHESALAAMQNGCVKGGAGEARAAWDPKQGPFPEDEMRASLQSWCGCIVAATRSSIDPSEFPAKGMSTFHRIMNASIDGAQCHPTGLAGRMLRH